MIEEARLWLPPASLADAETAVGRIIEEWAAAWFVAAPAPLVRHAPAAALAGFAWRGLSDVRLGNETSTFPQVGAAVCAGHGEPENPRDSDLLSSIGEEAYDHLIALLGGADLNLQSAVSSFGGEPAGGENGFRITAPGSSWTIGLVLGAEALTRVRRRTAAGNPPTELGTLGAALAGERSELKLHLGEAQLNAGEVAALGKGDVIALDRCTAEPVPVLVAGNACENGSARIEHGDDGLRATIVSPISLKARKSDRI